MVSNPTAGSGDGDGDGGDGDGGGDGVRRTRIGHAPSERNGRNLHETCLELHVSDATLFAPSIYPSLVCTWCLLGTVVMVSKKWISIECTIYLRFFEAVATVV